MGKRLSDPPLANTPPTPGPAGRRSAAAQSCTPCTRQIPCARRDPATFESPPVPCDLPRDTAAGTCARRTHVAKSSRPLCGQTAHPTAPAPLLAPALPRHAAPPSAPVRPFFPPAPHLATPFSAHP